MVVPGYISKDNFSVACFFFLWGSLTDALLKPPSNIASPPPNFVFIGKGKHLAWLIRCVCFESILLTIFIVALLKSLSWEVSVLPQFTGSFASLEAMYVVIYTTLAFWKLRLLPRAVVYTDPIAKGWLIPCSWFLYHHPGTCFFSSVQSFHIT